MAFARPGSAGASDSVWVLPVGEVIVTSILVDGPQTALAGLVSFDNDTVLGATVVENGRSAMRLARAETKSAAVQLEQAIQDSDDAGIDVPPELRDAGIASAGVGSAGGAGAYVKFVGKAGAASVAGEVFVADNAGPWVAAAKLIHVRESKFQGSPATQPAPQEQFKEPKDFAPPAVWFPSRLAKRVGGFAVAPESWGAFAGQVIVEIGRAHV